MTRSRPTVRRWGHLAGWAVAAPLGVFALLRLMGLTDRVPALLALATLTFWILLPAYLVAVAAVAFRTKALLAVAVALVALHLMWLGPDMRWWSTAPEPVERTSTIAAANITATNLRHDDVGTALAALDADVVVVVELTPEASATFERRGTFRGHPHRIEDPRPDFFGTAIYSRFPLGDASVLDIAGIPMSQATARTPGGPVTIVAVHTQQPLSGVGPLRAQLGALGELAARTPGPLVLAGDFNATRQHAAFRALLDRGLRDAHVTTGRGMAATWPADRRIPPFALLDRVVTSDDLRVHDIRETRIPGGDHLAVVATWSREAPE